MKTSFTFLFILSSLGVCAQTKILDSNIDWQGNNIIVYLSDSTVTQATVQIGSILHGDDVFNQSYSIGSSLSVSDNMLVIPLTGVSEGVYYIDVKVTDVGGTIQEMEYQSSN